VNNVETRYEYLENTHINDIVEYNGNTGTLKDVLLDLRIGNVLLLTRIE